MMTYIKLNLKRLDFGNHYHQSQKHQWVLEVGYKNSWNVRLPEKRFKQFLVQLKKGIKIHKWGGQVQYHKVIKLL